MAELVGLVASVASIVQACTEVVAACKRYNGARNDAQDMLHDVEQTAAALRALFDDMQHLGNARLQDSRSLAKVFGPEGDLKQCEDVLLRLEKLVSQRLNEINAPRESIRDRAKAQLARWKSSWIKEIQKLTRRLDGYRRSISEALQIEVSINE